MSQPPFLHTCEQCGQPLALGASVCSHCGARVESFGGQESDLTPDGLCLVSPAGKLIARLPLVLSIGRDADNGLRLEDHEVSRHHAVIERTPAGWQITDLHSTNGVWVNGHRINQATLLHEWDRLIIGKTQLRLEKR